MHYSEIPRHPLGMPPGSVRAILTFQIVGLFWLLLLIPDDRAVPIPMDLYFLLAMVMIFFVSHGKSIAKKGDPTPSPLWMPGGSIRFLLLAGTAAVIAYIGFNMWVKAVEKAGTTDSDAVIDSIVGVSVPNLTGGYSAMMPNHHITKPVFIGEIQADGQFETVWQTSGLVAGDEWSDYLPDSKDLISDWRKPMNCGNFNVATGKCGGKGTN